MNTFMGLEIGKRAILTHQVALDTTGHNIANANTDGYARQIPSLVTTRPWETPSLTSSTGAGQLGTGVDVASINRVRDEFIDNQIRNENEIAGYWQSLESTLAQVESIINEPSDDGLREVLDQFWESWQDVSNSPESEAVRTVVAQRGMAVAEAFNHTYTQLITLRNDLNAEVKLKASEVNNYAVQIADLNKQILAVTVAGRQANDLSDKRDLLVDKLSSLADVKVHTESNGMISLQLGDRMLVDGSTYKQMTTNQDEDGMYMLVWTDTNTRARIAGGEIRGLLDARGRTSLDTEVDPSEYLETIPNIIDQLNTMAKSVIVKTNQLHRGGYSLNNKTGEPDGADFFIPPEDEATFEDWAQFMQVTQSMLDDPKNLAAASSRTWDADGNKLNFGDGSNALLIAQLKQDLNNPEYDLKTNGINIDMDSTTAITFSIDTGDSTLPLPTIMINPPSTYDDMAALIKAVQEQLDEQDLDIKVRSDGQDLFFISSSVTNLDFINSDSGIQDIAGENLQNGEYEVTTTVNQPGAGDADLRIMQSYNQGSAQSIFGSGSLGSVTNAAALDVNASIELTVTGVDPASGQIAYNYITHEYKRDGSYASYSGSFTLNYGGFPSQYVTIGSLNFSVTGLDAKNNTDAAELKVGDKGVLNLTASTAALTKYQQLDIAYDYNSTGISKQSFIFDAGVLDNQTDKEIRFFTVNDNKNSQYVGSVYDGIMKLTTGILATANPLANVTYPFAEMNTGSTNTTFSVEFNEPLYYNTGIAIPNGTDISALFTYNGGALPPGSTAIYNLDGTVSFTITGVPAAGDEISAIADNLFNAQGIKYIPQDFSNNGVGWDASEQAKLNPGIPAAFMSYYKEPIEGNGMVQTVTMDDYWRSVAADIGVRSQEAQRMVENQEALLTELENKRQSVSGVSLDEEMTNMIKFQQSYNAAARFITTIDEQLNVIINGMGLVGR